MSGRPNVVLLVVDTVRRDRVSAYGYDHETTPTFDSFADSATNFADPVSQAPWSVPAHASLFTGRYPRDHGASTVRPIFAARDTLPQVLSRAGYCTAAVSPNEYVRPLTGFGRGFDEFHTGSRFSPPTWLIEVLRPAVHGVTATPIRRPFERLFNATQRREPPTTGAPDARSYGPTLDVPGTVADVLERAAEPWFLFVNLMDCHLPRSPAPEYFERFVDEDLADLRVVSNERAHLAGDRQLSAAERRKMSQLYDADLRTTDDRLAEVLAAIEAADGGDTLVALVSDHGEHLGEFGLLGHQYSVFEPAVSVPLAIRFPEDRKSASHPDPPATVTEQVETRRLYHTILDECGVDSFPRRSLASGRGDDVTRGSFISPMVDIEQFLWKGQFRYDRQYLGTQLEFRREGGRKIVTFADKRWVFGLPDEEMAPVHWECSQ